MELDVVKIGNSKGIRLPLAVIKQCGIEDKVKMEIKDNCIIIKPVKAPRQGWTEAFELMHKNRDDILYMPEEMDNETLEKWNE